MTSTDKLFAVAEAKVQTDCELCGSRLLLETGQLYVIDFSHHELPCMLAAEEPIACVGCGENYATVALFTSRDEAQRCVDALSEKVLAAKRAGQVATIDVFIRMPDEGLTFAALNLK